MANYSDITIIYNPNSTGPGKHLAERCKQALIEAGFSGSITITPTKHAGHAETLAFEAAKKGKRALVLSASGDGGYNEVINGVMRAQAAGFTVVAGVLPAGNANDHYHSVHRGNPVHNVVNDRRQAIDLLHIATTVKGQPYERYAHSYIGFGLTPHVGQALTKADLNRFKEMWITITAFMSFKPVSLVVNNHTILVQSLVASNIERMAKYMTLSTKAAVDDGKFEVHILTHRSKLRVIWQLVWASFKSFKSTDRVSQYSLTTTGPTLMQFDGETVELARDTTVVITIKKAALESII